MNNKIYYEKLDTNFSNIQESIDSFSKSVDSIFCSTCGTFTKGNQTTKYKSLPQIAIFRLTYENTQEKYLFPEKNIAIQIQIDLKSFS